MRQRQRPSSRAAGQAGAVGTSRSPIVESAHHLNALWRQYALLEARKDDHATAEVQSVILDEERAILSDTPTTAEEAIVILMVVINEVRSALELDPPSTDDIARGELAIRRATRFLAGLHGLHLELIAGEAYLPVELETAAGMLSAKL